VVLIFLQTLLKVVRKKKMNEKLEVQNGRWTKEMKSTQGYELRKLKIVHFQRRWTVGM